MNLQPILEHLQAQGLGEIGKTLFRHKMPHEVPAGLLLASQTPIQIHPYLEAVRKGSFQVIARGATEDEVEQRLNQVSEILSVQGLVLGGMRFFYIRPEHEPLIFPRSESDFVEASVDFAFVYVRS